VDASDAFDPASALAMGMDFSRLLWVRCGEKKTSRKHHGSSQRMSSDIPQNLWEGHDFRACPERSRMGAANRRPSPAALAAEDKRSMPQTKFPNWKNPESKRWESQLTQMLKVTDLLLQSNGFGMIALDFGDIPAQSARRIPLASWFRFRRVIEHTPTVLVVLEQQPIAGSCSSVLLKITSARSQSADLRKKDLRKKVSAQADIAYPHPTHSELLDQFEITAELLRSRLERPPGKKPVQSTASFKSRAAWA
jgi:hypothetical protein